MSLKADFNAIAAKLAPLYLERSQANHRQWQIEQDLAARLRALTPAEGWKGKNDEARTAAREAAFAEDETVQAVRKQILDIRLTLAELNGKIDAVEAERRGAEWAVRRLLADMLGQMGLRRDGAREGEGVPEFEDAPLAAADQAAEDRARHDAMLGQSQAEAMGYSPEPEEGIPF